MASLLTPDEAAACLHTYITRHPRAWNTMKPAVENTLGTPVDDRGTGLPVVRLRLTRSKAHGIECMTVPWASWPRPGAGGSLMPLRPGYVRGEER